MLLSQISSRVKRLFAVPYELVPFDAEYAREYEVVQRELEKDKGEPDWVFYYLTVANRYRVSPAHVPVIGYQEVIQGLSRDDVYSYYKLAYQPNNMVFSVAGDLDPEAMLVAIEKLPSASNTSVSIGRSTSEGASCAAGAVFTFTLVQVRSR